MLRRELDELDSRRNMVADLATLFWVPKALIGFQLQDILRTQPLAVVQGNDEVQRRSELCVSCICRQDCSMYCV